MKRNLAALQSNTLTVTSTRQAEARGTEPPTKRARVSEAREEAPIANDRRASGSPNPRRAAALFLSQQRAKIITDLQADADPEWKARGFRIGVYRHNLRNAPPGQTIPAHLVRQPDALPNPLARIKAPAVNEQAPKAFGIRPKLAFLPAMIEEQVAAGSGELIVPSHFDRTETLDKARVAAAKMLLQNGAAGVGARITDFADALSDASEDSPASPEESGVPKVVVPKAPKLPRMQSGLSQEIDLPSAYDFLVDKRQALVDDLEHLGPAENARGTRMNEYNVELELAADMDEKADKGDTGILGDQSLAPRTRERIPVRMRPPLSPDLGPITEEDPTA